MSEARARTLISELRAKIVAPDRIGTDVAHGLDWTELENVLPDGGFERGSVVEIASPHAASGGSSLVAVHALCAIQRKEPKAFCAWLDPDETLYGPGLARAGVDLSRLLVVRPPAAELGRIAVKVVSSGAFELVVIEMDPVHGATRPRARPRKGAKRALPPEVVVRKLALAAESAGKKDGAGTTVLLLTDTHAPRALPWPVALRLELSRTVDTLAVRVAKDRRGRVGSSTSKVSLLTKSRS